MIVWMALSTFSEALIDDDDEEDDEDVVVFGGAFFTAASTVLFEAVEVGAMVFTSSLERLEGTTLLLLLLSSEEVIAWEEESLLLVDTGTSYWMIEGLYPSTPVD